MRWVISWILVTWLLHLHWFPQFNKPQKHLCLIINQLTLRWHPLRPRCGDPWRPIHHQQLGESHEDLQRQHEENGRVVHRGQKKHHNFGREMPRYEKTTKTHRTINSKTIDEWCKWVKTLDFPCFFDMNWRMNICKHFDGTYEQAFGALGQVPRLGFRSLPKKDGGCPMVNFDPQAYRVFQPFDTCVACRYFLLEKKALFNGLV